MAGEDAIAHADKTGKEDVVEVLERLHVEDAGTGATELAS